MKTEVFIIHGGETFKNYRQFLLHLKKSPIDLERLRNPKKNWKANLGKTLGKNFEVIVPQMPNKQNAKYREWKIWFERFIPYYKSNIILVGHSLGGIFLAKYLSENRFPKKIRGTFLVAAPHHGTDFSNYSDSLGDFNVPKTLIKLVQNGGKIFLYHSTDDPVVPFSHFKKYRRALPDTAIRIFNHRGHFGQETFPELVRDIKELSKKRP